MTVRFMVVVTGVSLGGLLGWQLGKPGGIMTAYFAAVAGASVGLYIGRRIQRSLDDD